jgi:hypothetical protein
VDWLLLAGWCCPGLLGGWPLGRRARLLRGAALSHYYLVVLLVAKAYPAGPYSPGAGYCTEEAAALAWRPMECQRRGRSAVTVVELWLPGVPASGTVDYSQLGVLPTAHQCLLVELLLLSASGARHARQ